MSSLQRSLQLAGLARDMVRVKSSGNADGKDQARSQLVERLCALHGLPQKIGQILSLTELTDDQKVFTVLTESAPTIPSEKAFSIIENSLGIKIEDHFKWVDPRGISASIGQVHKAMLHDGRLAAIKFQYPGIREDLNYDLKALGWLTLHVGGLRRGFDLKAYQQEMGHMMLEEVDYRHEAQMLKIFSGRVSSWDRVETPQVIDELTNDKVITMTWLAGEPFEKVSSWSLEERREIAEVLLRLFLTGCFQWNVLHGDPHPGNYRFSNKDGKIKIGLLDFGCVKQLSAGQISHLGELIMLAMEGRLENQTSILFDHFVGLGFNPDLLSPMKNLLPALCNALFMPFCSTKPFSLTEWDLSGKVSEILGEFRWNFRIAGPAELLYFIRAYQGLIQYLKALNAPLDWNSAFRAVIPECLNRESRTEKTTASINLKELDPRLRGDDKLSASSLHIQVTESGHEKVSLIFQARCTENLPDLMPDDLLEKLKQRSIDPHIIAKRALETHLEPQELFTLVDGIKTVRVWLK